MAQIGEKVERLANGLALFITGPQGPEQIMTASFSLPPAQNNKFMDRLASDSILGRLGVTAVATSASDTVLLLYPRSVEDQVLAAAAKLLP